MRERSSPSSPSAPPPPSFAAGVRLPTQPLSSLPLASLLQQITEEGGFAFVSSAEKAAAGDFRAAEAAREMAWEQLHSGPWHSVVPAWRDAYAMSCLQVAAFHAGAGEFPEALRALDMGLIMGGMLLRKDLDEAVGKIVGWSKGEYRSERGVLEKGIRFGCGDEEGWKPSEVLRVLPCGSLSSKRVEKQASLSMERFLCDYFLKGFPVVLGGCIDHWPARTKWKDIKYLKEIAGDRTVPVEVGKNYLSDEWRQELITFSQFLERIQSNECCMADLTYLAQHPLFDQIQELRNDIMVPDYCFTGGGELQSINAWFGPAGTVTPLHHDLHHNLLAQAVGRKYIRLYPASISEELYPYEETMLKNSSQVDLDDLDLKKFPDVQDLVFTDCILEEGEMLYIPPKWWHYRKIKRILFLLIPCEAKPLNHHTRGFHMWTLYLFFWYCYIHSIRKIPLEVSFCSLACNGKFSIIDAKSQRGVNLPAF